VVESCPLELVENVELMRNPGSTVHYYISCDDHIIVAEIQ
jgi:hypothetical protein